MEESNVSVKLIKLLCILFLAGLMLYGCSSGTTPSATGYTVTVSNVPHSASEQRYVINYYNNNNLESGFECSCISVNGQTFWEGEAIDLCKKGNTKIKSKAIPITGLPVTDGACCISKPRAITTLPQPKVPAAASCWKY